MAVYSVILFFENAGQGWSESYWLERSETVSPIALLGFGKTVITNMAKKRAAMLGKGSTLTYIRVSDPTVKRDIIFPNFPELPISGALKDVDQPNAGILVGYWSEDPKVWSRRIFRGVPDTCIDRTQPKSMNKADGFFGALEGFSKYLQAAGSQWRIKGKGGNYQKYSEWLALRSGTKKTGRPFGLPRGRKSKRKIIPPALRSAPAAGPLTSSEVATPPQSATPLTPV